jgi:hypothetical protein
MKFCISLAVLMGVSISSSQVILPNNHRVAPPKPTQGVAKASGKTITAADIEPFLWEWYGKDAIYEAISYVMVTQDAAKKGVVISDTEVEKGIDAEIKKLHAGQAGTPKQAADALDLQGFTRSRLYMRVKETILIDKMVMAGFKPERFVKVSTILVRAKSADAGALSEAITKCQNAYEQLKKGEEWTKVLSTVTSDPKLIKSQGVLGWRLMEVFPDSVKAEIATLRKGGFTRPAQTQFGLQIFRVDEFGSGAKGEELAQLKNVFLIEERNNYMADLKNRANIKVLLK